MVESQIQKLIGERNFAGAAALQEDLKRSAAQEKDEEFGTSQGAVQDHANKGRGDSEED